MDAANVDLKAFTERFYEKLCFAHLEPVKETLVYLKRETNVWFEVTTLLIPGQNDSVDEVNRLCDWFSKELGPDVPLHFTAFHPDFKMTDVPNTPAETCRRAREQAKGFGLRHVYSGNIHDSDGQSTYCAKCGERVIERDWYSLGDYRLDGNRCAACGTVVPGVFPAGGPGTWGPKRKRIFIA